MHKPEGSCKEDNGDGYDQCFPLQVQCSYEDNMLEDIDRKDNDDDLNQGCLEIADALNVEQRGSFARPVSLRLDTKSV